MSGPLVHRPFVWALLAVPVLRAHADRCRGVDRWLALASSYRRATQAAWLALKLGLVEDPAYATGFLRALRLLQRRPPIASVALGLLRLVRGTHLDAVVRAVASDRRVGENLTR